MKTYIDCYNTQLPPSVIKHNINYINTVVLKLYNSNILDIDHIYALMYVMLCLCVYKVKDGVLQGSTNSAIKSDVFVSLAFELLLKANEHEHKDNSSYVCNFLRFFYNEFILNNYVNIFHFTTTSYPKDMFNIWTTLSLITQHNGNGVSTNISDVVLKILTALYKERFTQWNGMNDVVLQTKLLLVDFNKNSTHNMRRVLCKNEFLLKTIDTLIDKDNDVCGRDDTYKPKRSFYFSGSDNSYFTWKAGSLPHSELAIIFSFNLNVNNVGTKQIYSIMSVSYKQNNYINIYLNKDGDSYELVVHCTKTNTSEIIKTKSEIHAHKAYLTVITFHRKQVTIYYKAAAYNDYKSVSGQFGGDLKKRILCFHLGKSENSCGVNASPFKGFIGPVIGLIKSDAELIKHVFGLKGRYYYLLYINYYDFQCVEHSKREITAKDEGNAVEYFKKKCEIDIKDVIVFIVDPQAFDNVVPVNKYRVKKNEYTKREITANFLEFQEGTCFSGQRSVSFYKPFTQTFNVYKIYDRLFAFIDCGGFKYLALQFEFCFQVLLVYPKEKDVVSKM